MVAPLFLSRSCFAKRFPDLTTNTVQLSDTIGGFGVGDGNSFFLSDKWQGLTMLMNCTCNCILVHLCSHILVKLIYLILRALAWPYDQYPKITLRLLLDGGRKNVYTLRLVRL